MSEPVIRAPSPRLQPAVARPRSTGGLQVAAATSAAAAEACVLYPPVWLALESLGRRHGPLASFPTMAVLFAGAVAVAAGLRRVRSPALPVVAGAVVVGLVQARLGGVAGPAGAIVSVILSLVLAWRALALSTRDWRDPYQGAFAIAAIALLAEVLVGDAIGGVWARLLPLVVPLFFVAGLASRAASVRAAGEGGPATGLVAAPARMALRLLGAFAGLMLAGIALGGSALRALGRLALSALGVVVVAFLTVFAWAMRPVFWLASRFHVDLLAAFERNVLRARRSALRPISLAHRAAVPGPFQRLLGVLVLAAIAIAIAVALRRRFSGMWPEHDQADEAEPETEVRPLAPVPGKLRRGGGRRRPRELPEHAVRRWYAEALVRLEAKGLSRPRSATPDEFAIAAGRAFPACAAGIAALTRAYDDARYGLLALDAPGLEALGARVRELLAAIERHPRREPEAEPEAGPEAPGHVW